MHQYIRHIWNGTSKSNVEPKSNFPLFQSQIRQSRINLKLSYLVRIKLGTCEGGRLKRVMITVSSITKNTGRYAMIQTAFFIFLQSLLSIYHIALLAICTTQVQKESKKEKEKNNITKHLLHGDSNPNPPNQLELKTNVTIHCTTSVRAARSQLKEVYNPSPWWLTVFRDDFFGFSVELNF